VEDNHKSTFFKKGEKQKMKKLFDKIHKVNEKSITGPQKNLFGSEEMSGILEPTNRLSLLKYQVINCGTPLPNKEKHFGNFTDFTDENKTAKEKAKRKKRLKLVIKRSSLGAEMMKEKLRCSTPKI
jgi:hypothetical protein